VKDAKLLSSISVSAVDVRGEERRGEERINRKGKSYAIALRVIASQKIQAKAEDDGSTSRQDLKLSKNFSLSLSLSLHGSCYFLAFRLSFSKGFYRTSISLPIPQGSLHSLVSGHLIYLLS
jgi:hypothetical protein